MIRQDPQAWLRGYQDALDGRDTAVPPAGVTDALAYFSGAVEGKADRDKPVEERKRLRPECR